MFAVKKKVDCNDGWQVEVSDRTGGQKSDTSKRNLKTKKKKIKINIFTREKKPTKLMKNMKISFREIFLNDARIRSEQLALQCG